MYWQNGIEACCEGLVNQRHWLQLFSIFVSFVLPCWWCSLCQCCILQFAASDASGSVAMWQFGSTAASSDPYVVGEKSGPQLFEGEVAFVSWLGMETRLNSVGVLFILFHGFHTFYASKCFIANSYGLLIRKCLSCVLLCHRNCVVTVDQQVTLCSWAPPASWLLLATPLMESTCKILHECGDQAILAVLVHSDCREYTFWVLL